MTEANTPGKSNYPHFRHEPPVKTESGWTVTTSFDQHCSNCGNDWISVIRYGFTKEADAPGETKLRETAAWLYRDRAYFCPECCGFADSAVATHFPKGFWAALDDLVRDRAGERFGNAVGIGCTSIFAFVVSILGLSSTGSAVLLGFMGVLIAIGALVFALKLAFQSLQAKKLHPKLKAAVARFSEKEAADVFHRAKDHAWTKRTTSETQQDTLSLFGNEIKKASPEDCWCFASTMLDEAYAEIKTLAQRTGTTLP